MKQFKQLTLFFIIPLLSLGILSSCSKDDHNFSNDGLEGLWESTYSKGWEKCDGVVKDEWDEPMTDIRIRFSSDNKCNFYELRGNRWVSTDYGNYIIEGNLLILVFNDEVEEYTIKKLNSETLVLEMYQSDTYQGECFEDWERTTYKRIE